MSNDMPPPQYPSYPPYGASEPSGPSGYSVGTAFSYAWKKFTANLGPILIVMVVIAVGVVVLQLISSSITNGMSAASRSTMGYDPQTGKMTTNLTSAGFFGATFFVSIFFSLVSLILSMVIQAAIIRGALDLTYGRALALGSMFANINWIQVILASVLVGIATFVGFILCILPGFVVMFFTWFTIYFVIDKNLPAIDAIKASVNLVKNNAGVLILFFLACIAAYIVGAILCLVGLLAAVPVVVIAQAYTYRALQGEQVAA